MSAPAGDERGPNDLSVLGDTDVVHETFDVPDGVLTQLAKVWSDTAGFCAVVLCAMGDALGLWRALSERPLSEAELATKTGTVERYIREWAYGMVAAGYLSRRADGRYVLSPDLSPVLAEHAGELSAGGVQEMLLGLMSAYPGVVEAMRSGGGVAPSDYDASTWRGLDRFSSTTYEYLLCDRWLPAISSLHDRLTSGCQVVDIGCGHGRACLAMARAYPRSRFVGIDIFPKVVDDAREAAHASGLEERVRFEVADVLDGIPAADVITSFDFLHEADDPAALARLVADGLTPGGHWLVMETNCAPEPEGNAGPLGTMLYTYSLMFCLATTLARGGVGLGACGVSTEYFAGLVANAGFSEWTFTLPEHPFHRLLLARK